MLFLDASQMKQIRSRLNITVSHKHSGAQYRLIYEKQNPNYPCDILAMCLVLKLSLFTTIVQCLRPYMQLLEYASE